MWPSWKEVTFLKEAKIAQLDVEQLKEIKQLEEKLDITLIAYDISASGSQTEFGNSSDVINPS